jgi:hypothetical protein
MTAFTQAQFPTNIITIEQGAHFFCALLYDLHKKSKYQETHSSDLTPYITAQQGLAADETERIIYRVSFEMHPEYRTSTNKIWMDTLAFADATIPNRFLTI